MIEIKKQSKEEIAKQIRDGYIEMLDNQSADMISIGSAINMLIDATADAIYNSNENMYNYLQQNKKEL